MILLVYHFLNNFICMQLLKKLNMVSLSYCHMLLRVVNEWTKVQIWYTRCVLFLLALGWTIIWLWEMKRNPYSLIHAYNLDWLSSLHIIKLTLLLFMLIRKTISLLRLPKKAHFDFILVQYFYKLKIIKSLNVHIW